MNFQGNPLEFSGSAQKKRTGIEVVKILVTVRDLPGRADKTATFEQVSSFRPLESALIRFKFLLNRDLIAGSCGPNGALIVWRDDAGRWHGELEQNGETTAAVCNSPDYAEIWQFIRRNLPQTR